METLQVLVKQFETPSSISNTNLLGPVFDSQDSGKCMEFRPRRNPKDGKERRQPFWRKVAAPTGTSRPPTMRASIHHKCIRKDDSRWIRSGFTAFWIGLEMNFNPSATHLQIRARLPRSSAPESAPGYGSTLPKVELQSRKV